jgi:hypothetical protein
MIIFKMVFCLQNNARSALPAEIPSRRLAARSAARIGNEKTGFNPLPAEELVRNETVSCLIKTTPNFELILPNLVHQVKKRNLRAS